MRDQPVSVILMSRKHTIFPAIVGSVRQTHWSTAAIPANTMFSLLLFPVNVGAKGVCRGIVVCDDLEGVVHRMMLLLTKVASVT